MTVRILRRTALYSFLLMLLFSLSQFPEAGHIVMADEGSEKRQLTLVVMDPLAAPLACDCVKGYAQRKYEHLGRFLQQKLGRNVRVVWGESLDAAVEKSEGQTDIVVGKHSVVLADAKELGLKLRPIGQLTGEDDKTTQTGLIVVRANDPATKVSELVDYRVFFGPPDCDEKHSAPMGLLTASGVSIGQPMEISSSCSTAVTKLIELPEGSKAAAVISSYALPLLDGCGTVKKGDLRVIGESQPVPFITAFVNEGLAEAECVRIAEALMDVGLNAELLIHLQTGSGFEPWSENSTDRSKKKI